MRNFRVLIHLLRNFSRAALIADDCNANLHDLNINNFASFYGLSSLFSMQIRCVRESRGIFRVM